MVSCVYGGTRPPPELRLAWMCTEGALPESGGVLDQDYSLMHRMAASSNIHRVLTRLKNSQGADIHRLTDAERRLIRWLRDEGYI